MNKFIKISAVLLSVSAQQCASFKPVTIDDQYYEPKTERVAKLGKEKGLPALRFNDGDLLKGSWWAGTSGDMAVAAKNGGMQIICKNVGAAYTPFGMEMGAVDFTGGMAIKLVARAEGDDMPTLAVQFDDFEGFQSNSTRPTKRIHLGDDFKEYYFVIDDNEIWQQSWPDNHSVDGGLIQKILFFPNPGKAGFTGTIHIKEMQVIKQENMGKEEIIELPVGADGGLIADFNSSIDKWWTSETGFKMSLEEGALKMEAKGVGPKWEAFGTGFKTINVMNANELHVWARIPEGTPPPELRIDLKDVDGYTTNALPAAHRVFYKEGNEFVKYIFKYKGGFLQTYPDRQKVDGQRISELVCFINGGKAPWDGTIYIDKMEFKFTGKVEATDEPEEKNTSTTTSANTVIGDFTKPIYSWWSDDNIALKKIDNILEVSSKGATSEEFGTTFNSINFNETPVVKINAKASASLKLKVILKDIDEESLDEFIVDISAGEFKDYTVDLTGKLSSDVNVREIQEAIFTINPGSAFNGKLSIKSIKAVKK